MRTIHVRVRCPDTFSELPVGDVEQDELFIEGLVGTAFLEVFDTVLVENVTVQYSPERNERDEDRG
jgi:hypothetical protein